MMPYRAEALPPLHVHGQRSYKTMLNVPDKNQKLAKAGHAGNSSFTQTLARASKVPPLIPVMCALTDTDTQCAGQCRRFGQISLYKTEVKRREGLAEECDG